MQSISTIGLDIAKNHIEPTDLGAELITVQKDSSQHRASFGKWSPADGYGEIEALSVRCRHARRSTSGTIGNLRSRLPVAAKIALATAGAMPEVPGSPMPPASSLLWMM